MRRRRRQARAGRLRAKPITLTLHQPSVSGWTTTHVVYPERVSEIDRAAWASVVAELLAKESAGNKSAFARLIGVKSVQTIDRWLKGIVNVSEANVRQVARACGLNPGALLVRLGYYAADEISSRPAEVALTTEDEEALRRIRESELSPAAKRRLIEQVKRMRAEHERQRLETVKQMLDMAPKPPAPRAATKSR